MSANQSASIFDGIRVIDVGHIIAGPMTSSFLADFGADVIHIDLPNPETHFASEVVNRNKRNITLDLRKPHAKPIFHRLIATADVLTENFRPDRMDAWGHDWPTLHALNPRLVYARLSGFGLSGPYTDRRAYGMIGEAFGGWSTLNGEADGPAMHSAFSWGDTLASQYAAMAIGMALYWRDVRGGTGQLIDQGLGEPMYRQIEQQIIVFDQTGRAPRRRGNAHEANPYVGVKQTSDSMWFSYSASTRATIQALLTAVELDPQSEFAQPSRHVDWRETLDAYMTEWIASRTIEEVECAFVAAGACGSRVMNARDLYADPHIAARQMIVAPQGGAGDEGIAMQGVVPKFSASPGAVQTATARAGQHNDEIYGGLLGMADDELKALATAGVI